MFLRLFKEKGIFLTIPFTNSFGVIVFSLFWINLILSCSTDNSFDSYQSRKDNLIQIELDDLEFLNEANLDQYLSIKKVVELESLDSTFIINYDKVIISEERIFLLDKNGSYSVHVFNQNGNFLYSISNYGGGPNEYKEIRDVTVDFSNSTLNILDFASKTIWVYDINDGQLVKKLNLGRDQYYSSFESQNGFFVMSHGNNCGLLSNCKNLTISDNFLKNDSSFLSIPKNLRGFDLKPNQTFSRHGNNTYYIELLNDTIYEINPADYSFSAKFAIDFGRFQIPPDFKYSKANSSGMQLINYAIRNQKSIGINQYFISDSILYFNHGIPELKHVFFNILSKDGFSFNEFKTSNLLLTGRILGTLKNDFITLISDESLMAMKQSFESKDSLIYRQSNPEAYKIVRDRIPGSSPVIVYIRVNFEKVDSK